MTEHAGVMTLARLNLLQTRMSALILGVLVQEGIVSPKGAGALVRDVMGFLDPDKYDPEIVKMMRGAYEQMAQDFEATPAPHK